jgi:hypothetical protein
MRRVLRIRLEKEPKSTTPETSDEETFEIRADTIRKTIESLGAKMFLGMCIYMLLDTRRQVKVAETIHHPDC